MAFDACFLAAVVNELNENLIGARVEKVQQPEKDELILLLHANRQNIKLSISANASNPRINITSISKENPKTAPMFCMLLRKHLNGAKIASITQVDFERVIVIEFNTYDEMGFSANKYMFAEIMGKYSNIIFCDQNKKIISAIKIVDFTVSQKRQVLPGMFYELPPPQDKLNPLHITESEFCILFGKNPDIPYEKFITDNFMGISSLTAREMIYLSGNNPNNLWSGFISVIKKIIEKDFKAFLIYNMEGKPLHFSFMPISQYGSAVKIQQFDSFGQLLDEYFGSRDKIGRNRQLSEDISRLISNIEARLIRKIALQETDLAMCADKGRYKLYGDIITSNLYRLKKGMGRVELVNYYSDDMETVELTLNKNKTPVQNAQEYYKKYNKFKTKERELTKQVKYSKDELVYVYTVKEALNKAENEADINEIRRELFESGYASRMKNKGNSINTQKKPAAQKPMEFKTDGGIRILCGKNNNQNDYITTKYAGKNDYWFHVKNAPGSHVVMLCETGDIEPSDSDITQAAIIAAYYSQQRDGNNVPVDYTLIRNVKKPGGSKPGFVIYTTNKTAYVTPDKEIADSLRI
ncbi:MAG: NFACT RNA binding domain-containing protein [Eubacteriales bacterium]|nr:NFACT RNA binding domain-containing protein [Eubacteriales bacterium]